MLYNGGCILPRPTVLSVCLSVTIDTYYCASTVGLGGSHLTDPIAKLVLQIATNYSVVVTVTLNNK